MTWIVIPAYNEGQRIGKVIEEVKKYVKNVIVVDDGSKDNTYEEAKKREVTILKHIVNLGKGAAQKTGCDYAIRQGAKTIIVMDADGQHLPKEIPKFETALKGKDIVFGYRRFTKKMPGILRFGNRTISKIVTILFNMKLRDTQNGYRAFTANAYKKIRWKSGDYSMESEMIAKAGKHHLKYSEVPIETIYHDKYKGTTIIDGIKIVLNMIMWRIKGWAY